ncbi:glycosyltransferase [Pseudoalteromonas sp. ASV78]|uniref:glycosyltransferase n=1 Tax=Pseudoalteromonas sp. ASV78 TaxID=3397851 RepID=UPI0039FC055C
MIIFYNPYEKGFNTGATRRIEFLMSGLEQHDVKSRFYSKAELESNKLLSILIKIPILNRIFYFFHILFFIWQGHKVVTEVIVAPVFLKNVYLTIHDLKAFDIKAQRGRGKRILYTYFSKRAKNIISVSEYTKDQLIKLCGVKANRITIIYNGIRQSNLELLDKLTPTKKYDFVYVSSFAKHKRHVQLIEALPKSSSLLLIGRDFGELANVHKVIKEQSLNVTVRTDVETDYELYYSMKSADIGVFPSVYEGFGIPVLEYFAADLYVVTSDIPPFKELQSFTNLQYSADDAAELKSVLNKALQECSIKETNHIGDLTKFNELSLSSCLINLISKGDRD